MSCSPRYSKRTACCKTGRLCYCGRFHHLGDFLLCGISSQVHQATPEFDEIISCADSDFPASGLIAPSVIRRGFLAVLPRKRIIGVIGAIAQDRHHRLLENLSKYLVATCSKKPSD